MNKDYLNEKSLDPDDWDAFNKLLHKVSDDLVEYLKNVGERPVWKSLPEESKELFDESLPRTGTEYAKVYDEVKKHILPYPTNNIHPRFWSWVGGTGTPSQLIADMIISAMNSGSLGLDETASTYVEIQLLDWLKVLLDYPADSSGLLVSGGSMANLVGLAVARTNAAKYDVRNDGIDIKNNSRLIYYSSTETHSCIRKAIELLGLGSESLKLIPVNDDYTINLDLLNRAIESDIKDGNTPACIIANVGTVNTGAIDPLIELSKIAKKQNIWLHSDGAFGAITKLAKNSKHLVEGMELSDSIAFDLHKWMYIQYDCGCVLIKGGAPHKETFSVIPPYIKNFERGLASGPINFSEYGVQLSRSFKALRAWMALKIEGSDKFGELVQQNINQAKYLTDLVIKNQHLEILSPTSLNIVTFRYINKKIDENLINDFNAELLMRLHETGEHAPSSALLNGIFSIRVAITNHRSRLNDFNKLVDDVVIIGNDMLKDYI
ncbi:MAG: amino acid decarboxylase [Gammaproteobacteria bacterium]|nr:MAG: amino acid decarboxylase [Gammaproteobacteria bacterium]